MNLETAVLDSETAASKYETALSGSEKAVLDSETGVSELVSNLPNDHFGLRIENKHFGLLETVVLMSKESF